MATKNRPALSDERQLTLALSPLRNRDFLSNHWLEHRLPLEPEWTEAAEAARTALEQLLALWRKEKPRVELYGDEAGLEQKLIQPVFEILGWRIKYQAFLNGREPDYALFVDDDVLNTALAAGRKNPDFWKHATVVADAKAWHISLDRPLRVGSSREYPPEQIEWYLNHSQCDFGILTNGRLWRLVPRELGPSKPRFQTYLELDLPALLDSLMPKGGQLELDRTGSVRDDFLRFFLLFSPAAHGVRDGRKALIRRAIAGSSEYSLGVGDELRDRVFEAQRLCVEGFLKHTPNQLDPAVDLRACQEHSLIFLYRLLFIMYGEDRGLLPYRKNDTYTNNRSLARHRDEVAARLDDVGRGLKVSDYAPTTTNLWDDLKDLFDLIDRGHKRYGVQAYNGGLFDLEADTFLAEKALPDWYLARVLDQLGRAPQPDKPELGLFRVDYRDLAIQQLGSVYEGLLELDPRYASSDMRLLRAWQGGTSRRELIQASDEPIPTGYEVTGTVYRKGEIYLATDKGERRRTGSYYTPDHIVDHIVQHTLREKCAEISLALQAEISAKEAALKRADSAQAAVLAGELEVLRGDFDDRILRLKVLDPAMGSGHFLIRACQYLAEEIATNPYTSDEGADDLQEEESTITYWKRKVAENCLHGVDLNPMAVELAKLALWLETVAADSPLTFLDHHLQCGDSIIGARISGLNGLPRDVGLLEGRFTSEVESALPRLLEPLEAIRRIASDTAEHVKEKEDLYRRRFLPVRERLSAIADFWTVEAMKPGSLTHADYASALDAFESPKRFSEVLHADWARSALAYLREREVRPFHWQLAFPNVFLAGDHAGFDVILGNPPYEVLSEKETGRNVDHLRSFIEIDRELEPARIGKNNLYKLFTARSAGLLADGGMLSFIVPMSLLGDEQASGIRAMLLSAGEFVETHAFPQKDSVARRVFPEAKLATALFVFRRVREEVKKPTRFPSFVHPGRFIEADNSPLLMDSESIRVYDPKNLTIVSCTQLDWDLMASLRNTGIGRLGDYVEFFQGEVNQTVATGKGLLTKPGLGTLVMRGANISLYQLRDASQGEDLFLNVPAFLQDAGVDTKAFHHQLERVALQETSPQNNFRRIIACRVSQGHFCNHKINYTTSKHSKVDLGLVLFILNSAFSDWYFRLGSTNASVSHYQLANIPCPKFDGLDGPIDSAAVDELEGMISNEKFGLIEHAFLARAAEGSMGATLARMVIRLVRFIESEEAARGEIARTQRSSLSERAAFAQAILDKTLVVLLGMDVGSYAFIKGRLETML